MAKTHTYELQLGDTAYEGELELSSAGMVGYNESGPDYLSGRVKTMLENVLDELAKIPAKYDDLTRFEVMVQP